MDSKADVPNGESTVDSTIHIITFVYVKSFGMNHLFMPLYPQGHDGVVTLCRYPFVFDAQAKTTLLQTDAVIQMQVIYKCLSLFAVFFSPFDWFPST